MPEIFLNFFFGKSRPRLTVVGLTSIQLGKGEHCVYWFGQRNYSKVQHGMQGSYILGNIISALYDMHRFFFETALMSKFDDNRESFAGLLSTFANIFTPSLTSESDLKPIKTRHIYILPYQTKI